MHRDFHGTLHTHLNKLPVLPQLGIFQRLMNLSEAPKWKQMKLTLDEFEEVFGGRLMASVRYDTLKLSGTHVNIRWTKETGEFRFGGTYGK